MNTLELMSFARRIISDQGLQVWGGDSAIIEHLDVAYEKIHGRFASFDIGIGEVYQDFTYTKPASGVNQISFLLPKHFEQVKVVEMLDTNGNRMEYTAWPADQVRILFPGFNDFLGYVYWIRNNTLTIDTTWAYGAPIPTTIRVWFYRSPSGLLVFQPSGATATTVTFPTEPYEEMGKIVPMDGWYDGSQWEVVSGKGQGQMFEIGSFVGSSRVGTLTDGYSLNPIPDGNSIVAAVPAIPRRAHALIAYETALDGARIEENQAAAILLQAERQERWADIDKTLSVRQVQMNQRITNLEAE